MDALSADKDAEKETLAGLGWAGHAFGFCYEKGRLFGCSLAILFVA